MKLVIFLESRYDGKKWKKTKKHKKKRSFINKVNHQQFSHFWKIALKSFWSSLEFFGFRTEFYDPTQFLSSILYLTLTLRTLNYGLIVVFMLSINSYILFCFHQLTTYFFSRYSHPAVLEFCVFGDVKVWTLPEDYFKPSPYLTLPPPRGDNCSVTQCQSIISDRTWNTSRKFWLTKPGYLHYYLIWVERRDSSGPTFRCSSHQVSDAIKIQLKAS